MDLENIYDKYEISCNSLPKDCGFETKETDVQIDAWQEHMRKRLIYIFWPRFCQALRAMPKDRIPEQMYPSLIEAVKILKLPPRYLRAKKNAWDKKVEKTCYIATGETTDGMK
jgi:hypothetical protein